MTEEKQVNRGGLIGDLIDYLIGPKTQVITKTRYTGGLKGRDLRYMEIVKSAENKVKMEKTREQQRKNR